MKKYIFIILLFLLAYEAYPQVRLSTMDSVTTFTPTDLFWLNTKPSSTFLNRKVSWRSLRSNIEDFIADSAHTWAQRQTFSNGATFSAATYGSTTFSDSLCVVNGAVLAAHYIRPYLSTTGYIGDLTKPFGYIYSKNFVTVNAEGNDSCTISYDDSVLTINKELSVGTLTVTDNITMDSSGAFQSIHFKPNTYAITAVDDSIITIDTLKTNIELTLPGDVTSPGIEKITMTGVPDGHIIILYHHDLNDSVVFQDANADGNLKMAGDFYMNVGDNIAFMMTTGDYGGSEGQHWIELWRKDN